jgi:long-chain acyl-CoA synthetase
MAFTLPEALTNTVRAYGARPAFLFEDRSYTWLEAGERISRLADSLHRLGVRRGERVAIVARNSFRFEELKYALFWLGAASVQLNWRLAPTELHAVLADCDPMLLAVDETTSAGRDWPRMLGLGKETEALIESGRRREPAAAHEDDDAILFYTSGTTARSKGVRLSHRNILHAALAYQGGTSIRPSPEDVYLHVSPMFHAAELLSLPWILQGAAHVYLPGFTPAGMLDAIERYGVTCVNTVPTMLIRLLSDPAFSAARLGSLRVVLFGSASMAAEWVERAVRAFPPRTAFYQGYGLTETAPNCALLEAELLRAALLERKRPELVASVGRPLTGISVRILGPRDEPCAAGEAGEVLIRGPNIMKGYLNRPEETASALEGGWLHTGDLGMLDAEGFLYILDRIKDMIITGGENVYSAEVETALASHPAILDNAVFGIPDEIFGEAVAAAIVPVPGAKLDTAEVLAHCRKRIAGYKVPRALYFVDELPRTPIGKVAKTVLRDSYRARRASPHA